MNIAALKVGSDNYSNFVRSRSGSRLSSISISSSRWEWTRSWWTISRSRSRSRAWSREWSRSSSSSVGRGKL